MVFKGRQYRATQGKVIFCFQHGHGELSFLNVNLVLLQFKNNVKTEVGLRKISVTCCSKSFSYDLRSTVFFDGAVVTNLHASPDSL